MPSIAVFIAGITSADITDRIISISKIHDTLESDIGQFQFPQIEIEIDNSINWVSYYNTYIKADDVYIDIFVGEYQIVAGNKFWQGETIFRGYLENVNLIDNNTLNLKVNHILGKLGEIARQISDETQDGTYYNFLGELSAFLNITGQELSVNINLSFKISATNYTLYDVWIDAPYYNRKINHLHYLGDLLRSFCAVIYWRNNTIYIQDREGVLIGNTDDVNEKQLFGYKLENWDKKQNNFIIESTYFRSGIMAFKQSTNADENSKKIVGDLLGNTFVRDDRSFIGCYQELGNLVLERYEDYFGRDTNGAKVILNGLLWYPGQKINILDTGEHWFIEETWKDLENRVTEATINRISDNRVLPLTYPFNWDWGTISAAKTFQKLSKHTFSKWN